VQGSATHSREVAAFGKCVFSALTNGLGEELLTTMHVACGREVSILSRVLFGRAWRSSALGTGRDLMVEVVHVNRFHVNSKFGDLFCLSETFTYEMDEKDRIWFGDWHLREENCVNAGME